MRSLLVLAALCLGTLLVVPPSTAEASVVEAMSLAELANTADVVIVARVEAQRSRYDAQGRIVTVVTLRVEESLYGRLAAGSVTEVLRLGGAVGDLGLRVEGEALYQSGETIVLFGRWVTTLEGETLRPVGMSQGVLPMRTDGGVEMIAPGGAGLELVTRDANGRLVPAPGALATARPRDELLDEIRALVAERERGR